MNRDYFVDLMKSKIRNINLQKHMFATEAILKALAPLYDGNVDEWGIAGLLHDIDYEETVDKPQFHGEKSVEILKDDALPDYVLDAIKRHSGVLERKTHLDKALYASDPLTGLIVAGALIHPDRSLSSIDTQFLMNRFYEKSFAKGANRDQIASCSELGIDLVDFISLGLNAMLEIRSTLGL